MKQTFEREIVLVLHNFNLGGREFVVLFFNGILVDKTKCWSSARNVEIRFRTPSQFRQFVVEVGLMPEVRVVKRDGISKNNS